MTNKPPGLYKEGKYLVQVCTDGNIWTTLPNPLYDNIELFESLPEGLIKSQEELDSNYYKWIAELIDNSTFTLFDFSNDIKPDSNY